MSLPRSFASPFALSFALVLAGCSAASDPNPARGAAAADAGAATRADADVESSETQDAATTEPAPSCAAPPSASKCKNEGAWVRGVARFDPAHFAAGAKPILRVSLRHSFALLSGEEKIGGRLHAFKSIPIKDPSSGEVPFAIDMCMFGVMWSDENDPFNLVLHIDENDNNDLSAATTNKQAMTIATPDPGELVKVVRVDVSCHAASPCLAAKLDCVDGSACTTIEAIKTCKKRLPGCESDDAFCE